MKKRRELVVVNGSCMGTAEAICAEGMVNQEDKVQSGKHVDVSPSMR